MWGPPARCVTAKHADGIAILEESNSIISHYSTRGATTFMAGIPEIPGPLDTPPLYSHYADGLV